MVKTKDVSTAIITKSADTSNLRRSGRGTPSKKQETITSVTARKSERIEKQTSPNPTPVKKKHERIEKQVGPSPLRRSDRGKKLVEIHDLPKMRSKKEKTSNTSKQSVEDVNEDSKNERDNPDVGDRKRKRFSSHPYKTIFKPQRIRVELVVDNELKSLEEDDQTVAAVEVSPSSQKDQETYDEDKNTLLNENLMDLEQAEHVGNLDKQIIISSSRINDDLENQQELESCDKVTETCKPAGDMENAENSDLTTNSSKFVEFWVPVQMSNMQLEQYCATLLSNAIALRSCSKSDTLGALSEILISIRKCCNHPYLVDPKLQTEILKKYEPNMLLDVGIKASGKLQFLDIILPEVKKHQLRVLILFQPIRGTLSGSASIGNILEDFILQRFGQDSYERVDGFGTVSSKKQAALNKFNTETSRFIFLLESRACHQSIKLSSIDIIIIFDSDLIPTNDLKSLQKVHIDSQSEQIMISRLYSSSTLEEQIIKLAEQNVAIDIKTHNLRSNYDALLTWGVSDLFDKLTQFHNSSVENINVNINTSSEDLFSKNVIDEFLYLISHKYKSNDTEKLLIKRVENYGKNIPLHSEIKINLPDGEQPHVFWKKLLDRRAPLWKYVSESTPRLRKRPNYFLDSSEETEEKSGAKRRRKTLNTSTESAQLRPVIEGDWFWSTEISNEMSLHDLLKPTVSELCNVLNFSEDVKIKVETFLDFVLKNFHLSKEHTTALQAFIISLGWIGSSLAKYKIDRRESFDLAKKHLDFSCTYEETESVCKKLELAKEAFLQDTEIPDALTDCIPAPQTEKSQHEEEIEKFNRLWDDIKANLEKDYEIDGAFIRFLHSNPSIRSEKLIILEKEFVKKLEEYERLRETCLEELKSKSTLVADENEVSLRGSHEVVHVDPTSIDGADDIESTGSHTSGKQVADDVAEADVTTLSERVGEIPAQQNADVEEADAVVLSEQIGETPAQQNDDVDDDMEEADAMVLGERIGDIPAQQNDDVEEADAMVLSQPIGEVPAQQNDDVDPVEMEVVKADSNQEHNADVSHAVEDSYGAGPVHVAPPVESGEMGTPAGNCNEENEAGPDDVAPLVNTGEMGMPAGNCNRDGNATGLNDVAPHVESEMGVTAGNCNKDSNETVLNDVAAHVDSEMGVPAGNCNKDGHETGIDDVAPHVDSEMGMPAGNCNEENAEDGGIIPNTSPAGDGEHHSDLCGSSRSNPPPADVPQENTHSVEPIPEIENEPLQLQQLPQSENQEQADPNLLSETNDEYLQLVDPAQILPEDSSDHHLPNPDPPVITETQNQNTLRLDLNRFDNINYVGPHMLNHSDPLRAEMERLNAVEENVVKYHQDIKQRLNFECEKEIAEVIAQIRLKYDAKRQEAEAALLSKKNQLHTNIDRLIINRILADAFRAKCRDLMPDQPGLQQLPEAGLMQQPHRVSGQSFVRPLQPPLQIVHQPAALFSSRPSPNINPPILNNMSTRPSPPPATNPTTPSARPPSPPTVNPITRSTTPTTSRPPPSFNPITRPPTVNPITPSSTPTTSRLPPVINPVMPSSTQTTPPTINPISSSSTPTTSRLPAGVTTSVTLSHLPPGVNRIPMDLSAANLRVNTETQRQHIQHVRNGEIRSGAPDIRPMGSTEIRPRAPYTRPLGSSDIRAPAPHIQPFRSTLPVPGDFASQRGMPPPATSSVLPHSSSHAPSPHRWHNNLTTPSDLGTEFDLLNISDDIIPHSSDHDVVCLSDDE